MDGNLTGIEIPGQNGPGNNDDQMMTPYSTESKLEAFVAKRLTSEEMNTKFKY